MVIVTMEILWSICLLAVLASVHPAQTHTVLQGLSCVNDYVNNVSCMWNSSHIEPGVDCWIFGQKKAWTLTGRSKPLIRSCKLKQLRSSVQGCSFVFEKKVFSCSEIMPSIHVQCDGMAEEVKNLTNYKPCDHIKMHPPGVPNVTTSANDTWISWSPGSPRSKFFTHYEFQLQIKQNHQKWEEASTLPTQEQKQRILAGTMKTGQYQVRVRVKPSKDYPHAHWSDWSPTISWVIASNVTEDKVPPMDHTTLWLLLGGLSSLFIIILIIYLRSCLSKGLFKEKPVPNPSTYFHTLHSVHGGNVKKWLNPRTAAESFFTAQPHDQISPVEVFDVWDVVPSSSPSSTTTTTSTSALLHSHSGCPSSDLDTSGIVDHSSSSSSSCFSNLGYFYSSYPSTSLQIDPGPVYFTYRDDFHDGRSLHLSLCPSLTSSSAYESLRWPGGEHSMEPQSPDSGFGVSEEDQVDLDEVDSDQEEVSGDHDDSPLLTFPLQLPSWMCPPSFPSPPCPPSSSTTPFHPPSPPQVHLENKGLNVPEMVPSGSYVSLPAGGAMCRSSSMPVEACKTGYLTLKELQTTYSNKSI